MFASAARLNRAALISCARLTVVTVILVGIVLGQVSAAAQQGTLQIVAPADGVVVQPGQTISVTVTATGRIPITRAAVIGEGPVGVSTVAASLPFEFVLTVNGDAAPGKYLLIAIGRGETGPEIYSEPIAVAVETASMPVALVAEPPDLVFESLGQQIPVRVLGRFADGSIRNLTQSSHVRFFGYSSVAVIDSSGTVTAGLAGSTALAVAYVGDGDDGISVNIPVTVLPSVVSASVTSLDFGEHAINESGILQVTLTNSSKSRIGIISVDADGDFTEVDNCLAGRLDVAASCTVSVSFNPVGVGLRAGSLTIANTTTVTPVVIPLVGTGIATGDATPPVTSEIITPEPNGSGWNNSDVTVALESVDDRGGSGVKGITYGVVGAQAVPVTTISASVAQIAISAEGTSTVSFFATDYVGNTEAATTHPVRIDKTVPTISAGRHPLANPFGWNNSDVIVEFNCSDNLSGLADGGSPSRTVLSNEGADQSVVGACTDLAGNIGFTTVANVNIDRTPPRIVGDHTTRGNVYGWYNGPVNVVFACDDDLSGLTAGSSPIVTSLAAEGAMQSVAATCTDLADNTASAFVHDLNIDMTAPTITVAAADSVLWPPDGKLVPVTISGLFVDGLSGFDPSSAMFRVIDEYSRVQPTGAISLDSAGRYSLALMLEASRLGGDDDGRRYEIVVTARDKAGNVTSASTVATVPHDQRR
jgi:hypothetical protein